jgi:hypothetical protein
MVYAEGIRVRVTGPDGHDRVMGYWELFTLLWHDPQQIRAIDPLTPRLAFALYLHDQLVAWDVRPVLCGAADSPTLHALWGLRTWGPPQAVAARQAALRALSPDEQRRILADAVILDTLEPGRERVPLRGLCHRGWHDFDTGGDPDDFFRVFRYLDAALRAERRAPTPEATLAAHDQQTYRTAIAPTVPEDIEDFILHITKELPPGQRDALRHWLRAQHLGVSFNAYCAQHGLSYKTVDKAMREGLDTLRKKK